MNIKKVHLSGSSGDVYFHFPKKVKDGKVISVYKRPAITCTRATGDALLIFLSEHKDLTIEQVSNIASKNVLLIEENMILKMFIEAGYKDLIVRNVFDFTDLD